MRNTFRDLKPGDIVFVLIENKIIEAKVFKLTEESIYIDVKRYSNNKERLQPAFNIIVFSDSFDRKYMVTADKKVVCVNDETVKMFKYKYHRLEAYKSMERVKNEMTNAVHHLDQTKYIMRDLIDVEESIDWNDLIK